MKKILSLALAMMMLLSVASSALAVDFRGNVVVSSANDEQLQGAVDKNGRSGGQMIAYVVDKWDVPGKWVEFNVSAPSQHSTLYTPNDHKMINAAEYCAIDEKTYAYSSYSSTAGSNLFGTIDLDTGEFVTIGNSPRTIRNLAMDYSTGDMYALLYNTETLGDLYKVNRQTGVFTLLGTIAGVTNEVISIAIATDGTIYAVDFAGALYTIDLSNVRGTKIGNTGLKTNYASAFTYDHDSQTLYWAHYEYFAPSTLYSINTATAQATNLGSLGNVELRGLHTRYSGYAPEPIHPEGVSVSPSTAEILDGKTVQLYETLLPAGGYFEDNTVTWSSSDNGVATVSDDGLVTGVAKGTAIITATTNDGGHEGTATITVLDTGEYFAELNVAVNAAQFGEEDFISFETDELYPFVVAEQEEEMVAVSTNQGHPYSSSTLRSHKPVSLAAGDVISFDWKVSSDSLDVFSFNVGSKLVAKISGNQDWETFRYTVEASGQYILTWQYTKDNTGDALLDSAWIDNIDIERSGEIVELEGIEVTPRYSVVLINATVQLEVQYFPNNATNPSVSYTSSNPNIATVTPSGLVTAKNWGITVISVESEDGGWMAYATIEVKEPCDKDQIPFHPVEPGIEEPNEYPVCLGGEGSAFINENLIKYAYGFSIYMEEGDGVLFTTEIGEEPHVYHPILYVYDEDFNQVAYSETSFEGSVYAALKFIPKATGTYYIVLTTLNWYQSDWGNLIFCVQNYEPIMPTSVKIMPQNVSINVGGYVQLNAAVSPITTDYADVIWSVDDSSIATITQEGLVRGMKRGTAYVTATTVKGGLTDTIAIEVGDMVVPEYDGKIYAYSPSMYTDLGIGYVSYEVGTSINDIQMVKPDTMELWCATYFDGVVYGYEVINYGFFLLTSYVMVDPITFTLQAYTELGYDIATCDMAYDFTQNVMYVIVGNVITDESFLATVDVSTGMMTVIASMSLSYSNKIVTIACDNQGALYGITTTGEYYGIDKYNGLLTQICKFDYRMDVTQTIVFNNHDDRMYWFQTDTVGDVINTRLVIFEPETGKVISAERSDSEYDRFSSAYVLTTRDLLPPIQEIPLQSVEIDPSDITIYVDNMMALNVRYAPINATNRDVTWSSNNPAVVSVDSDGVITGVHPGKAYITVKSADGGHTHSVLVTVIQRVLPVIPTGYAAVTLEAGDVWGDGTGYQMLLDSTARAFETGVLNNESYSLFENGLTPQATYDAFDYKIPKNADPALDTSEVVLNDSITVLIPSGTYDWVITNPVPGDTIWIAYGGRSDNYVFEAGYSYTFSVIWAGTSDLVVIISDNVGENVEPPTMYTVDFLNYDGEFMCSYETEKGTSAVAPVPPTHPEGVPFLGWDIDFTNVQSDLTVTAVFSEYELGDVNMDANVNTGDAAYILQWIVGTRPMTEFQEKLSDFNKDGKANTGDAAAILKKLVGAES